MSNSVWIVKKFICLNDLCPPRWAYRHHSHKSPFWIQLKGYLPSLKEFCRDLPQPASREAVGDQAQLCWSGLSTFRPSTAGPADATERGRQAVGGVI